MTLEGNDFVGAIGLYGMPGTSQLNLGSVSTNRPKLTLAESDGILRVRGNRLARLTVSGRIVGELNGLSGAGAKPVLVRVHGRSLVSDNAFFTFANHLLVSARLAMTANAFGDIRVDEGTAFLGTVVANTATFVGNHGPFSAANMQLRVAALSQQAAANIELAIS